MLKYLISIKQLKKGSGKMFEKFNAHIQVNGGATFTLQGRPTRLKSGFMVALKEFETVIKNPTKKKLDNFIKKNMKELKKNNRYIGGWMDNNKLYLDISVNVKCPIKAVKKGKKEKQLAIFDIANLECINL